MRPQILKRIFSVFTYLYGLFYGKKRPKRVILCYHRLIDRKRSSLIPHIASNFVEVSKFENQIKWLCSFAIPRSLDQIIRDMSLPCKKWEFCITFDDGYRDVLELGLPIFRKYGIPVAIFLNSHFVLNPACLPWPELLDKLIDNYRERLIIEIEGQRVGYDFEYLGEREKFAKDMREWFRKLGSRKAKELRRRLKGVLEEVFSDGHNDVISPEEILSSMKTGLIEFGGHSSTHVNLDRCDEEELTYEIINDRNSISQIISQEAKYFSYPYGKQKYRNRYVIEYVRKSGYLASFTIDPGYLLDTCDIYEVPRLAINGEWDFVRFKSMLLGLNMFNYVSTIRSTFAADYL